MRFLAVVTGLGLVLVAGLLLLTGAPAARADVAEDGGKAPLAADAGVSPAALPGTDAEARDYAQREAESPEAQEFVGGWLFGLLVFVALVLLIVYLAKEI